MLAASSTGSRWPQGRPWSARQPWAPRPPGPPRAGRPSWPGECSGSVWGLGGAGAFASPPDALLGRTPWSRVTALCSVLSQGFPGVPGSPGPKVSARALGWRCGEGPARGGALPCLIILCSQGDRGDSGSKGEQVRPPTFPWLGSHSTHTRIPPPAQAGPTACLLLSPGPARRARPERRPGERAGERSRGLGLDSGAPASGHCLSGALAPRAPAFRPGCSAGCPVGIPAAALGGPGLWGHAREGLPAAWSLPNQGLRALW